MEAHTSQILNKFLCLYAITRCLSLHAPQCIHHYFYHCISYDALYLINTWKPAVLFNAAALESRARAQR